MNQYSKSEKDIQESSALKLDSFRQAMGLTIMLLSAIVVMAYNGFMLPDGEKPDVWFQRSGSVAAILAIFADYLSHQRIESFQG